MPGRGCFVVLEGGDGAGKGTALVALREALTEDGHDVLPTREPGGTPEGLQLRALLLASAGTAWDDGAELLLMTAARVQHVKRVIEPALAAGRVVLCDRFVGSTLAYQGAGRGLPADLILDLHRRFVGDIWPDLTVLLDVEPAIGLRRSRTRLATESQDEGRFEDLDPDFHARVRQSFLDQAPLHPDRTLVVDAGQPIDIVRNAVVSAVRSRLTAWDGSPGSSAPA